MKKTSFLALSIFSLNVFSLAQEVIQNPVQPLNPNAGRVLTLKEELRIADTGQGFYFKNPYPIRVSVRGDILLRDGQDQVLLFDNQGRFLRNLLKKGQGPGELTSVFDIGISPNRFYLLGYPSKLLAFDAQGTLDKETNLQEVMSAGPTKLVVVEENRIITIGQGRPERTGSGLTDIPNHLYETASGGTAKKLGSFPIQGYFQILPNGGTGMTTWNSVNLAAISDASLAVNSSPEYLIGLFDLKKETFTRRFTRSYRRVKRSSEGGVSGGGNTPPPPEFAPDIWALHAVDGKIWAQTSTVDEQKGILFDVYDIEGRYLDCFYIPTTRKDSKNKPINMTLTIAGGAIYFSEKTEDDLIVIKKYRLVGL